MTNWKNFAAVIILAATVFANMQPVWADKGPDKAPKFNMKACQCNTKSGETCRCLDKDRQKDCRCQDKKNGPGSKKFDSKRDGRQPNNVERKNDNQFGNRNNKDGVRPPEPKK
ncbi:MAG: hypothetical protein ACI38Q_00335 [Candidatus Bruticola sp.]